MPRKKNPDITLEAFLASEQEDLAKFKRWWTKMQKRAGSVEEWAANFPS